MCKQCSDTGMWYDGNGHRKTGYPLAEGHVSKPCSCAAGRKIRQQNARTCFPDSVLFEVAEREQAERMAAASRSRCASQHCGTWMPSGQKGLCKTCEREAYWS